MSKQNEVELLFRTLEGETTEAEQAALQKWLDESPENRRLFAELKALREATRAQEPKAAPDTEAAWQKVSARIRAGESRGFTPVRSQSLWSFSLWARGWGLAAAIAVLLIVVGYGSYRASLPAYYSLAELQAWEQQNLDADTRSESQAGRSEFARAAEALLSARQNKWGFFPYFDSLRVQQAIAYLENAYSETEDPASRNKYAYFLAKAHLMQEDATAARHWLERIMSSEAAAYQQEAGRLRERLEL